ncbi:kinesin-domain-containing protein [Linderina pennispora]|uniref:Kinesin-domain-containing protein n=1 Tax=Linderina pennispora TaxID=61395 RepID=A0A1Y1WJH1_9FUNG|nr:kinesin-domain-containing protein [Linderina pennispora]ORX73689.1 kinesin-domain-containing protein [Linderina pennispora]
MEDHINVAIRIRPLNQREVRNSTTVALNQLPWHVNRDTIIQRQYHDGRFSQGNSYTFDKVFDQKDTTQKVYDNSVKGIIQSTLAGFNGTIFAYGQTSSGKTHTMHGIRDMFSKIAQDERREYLLRVSFLEIYNEVLRDLLEPSKASLKIHENAKREIFVGDLSEHIVFNAEQVEELLAKGDRNRHIAGTNMNERSSRSHTIFRIVAESREKSEAGSADSSSQDGDMDVDQEKHHQRLSSGSLGETGEFTGAVMVSCLNLVDLAGSERVGLTGAEGQRLKEGGHINKSLLSLSTVIARLSEDGGDRGHIPYRDSKLTRILQPSLGGNARTLIICTITPAQDYVEGVAVDAQVCVSRQNHPEQARSQRGAAWRCPASSPQACQRA